MIDYRNIRINDPFWRIDTIYAINIDEPARTILSAVRVGGGMGFRSTAMAGQAMKTTVRNQRVRAY